MNWIIETFGKLKLYRVYFDQINAQVVEVEAVTKDAAITKAIRTHQRECAASVVRCVEETT
jgi:hypothetical protein